jgi:hypothetical protein
MGGTRKIAAIWCPTSWRAGGACAGPTSAFIAARAEWHLSDARRPQYNDRRYQIGLRFTGRPSCSGIHQVNRSPGVLLGSLDALKVTLDHRRDAEAARRDADHVCPRRARNISTCLSQAPPGPISVR